MGQANHLVSACRTGNLSRAILAAIVDHQNLNLLEPLELARDQRKGSGNRFRLVITGDLDH
jgi:hypothetical protein